MLERVDRLVSLRVLILAFPAVFLLHDSEEVLTTERFLRENRARMPLPAFVAGRMEVTTAHFAAAVAYLLTLVSGVSYLAARSLRPGAAANLFAAAVSLLFLNVFTHLGQALLLRRVTPGAVSAVAVALPYSVYTLRRLQTEKLIDGQGLSRAMIRGALLAGPVLLSAHVVGKAVTRRAL